MDDLLHAVDLKLLAPGVVGGSDAERLLQFGPPSKRGARMLQPRGRVTCTSPQELARIIRGLGLKIGESIERGNFPLVLLVLALRCRRESELLAIPGFKGYM
jgi:hypothetical protein